MKTLIAGSLAFDTIMVFDGHFKDHILADQTHILNVCFLAPKMQRFRGGCAGNMAYNLKLLGADPLIMATVGEDFAPYANWLDEHDFSRDHIKTIAGQFTAQAFVTSDIDNNQITAFHPGAMDFAQHNKVSDAKGVELGVVGPDGRAAMIEHAAQFAAANIPFFFDPGQQLPLFDGSDILTFLDQASYTIVNDYESQLLIEKTGKPLSQLTDYVDAFIVTHGGQGSRIYVGGEVLEVASAPITNAIDPTGCGDAYRAGVLFGLANDLDWQSCGQMGALCGAIKIEHSGTQGHSFTIDEFAERFVTAFKQPYPLA